MKNMMVANLTRGRYKQESIELLLKAQIENSLELGWRVEDIVLLSNFEYEFLGVRATRVALNETCLTGSKMFAMKYLYENGMVEEPVWAHDLDAWQNVCFNCPEFLDVGVACYSNDKFNGGSIFWKKQAADIVDKIISEIEGHGENKEEPTLNRILRSHEFRDRVTVLNNTFNVGCSGYVKRWDRSIKPIRVCHFHPYNHTAWETHALDRNGLNEKGISDRLEQLLRRYYPKLATELSRQSQEARVGKVAARQALLAVAAH
jgi:hypothetical protein